MPRGTRIRSGELAGRLATLDIDEGIRLENAEGKMFVNRNASGFLSCNMAMTSSTLKQQGRLSAP